MTQHIVYVPESETAAFIQYVEAHGYAYEPVEADTEDIPEWHKDILRERAATRDTATYVSHEEVIAKLEAKLKRA